MTLFGSCLISACFAAVGFVFGVCVAQRKEGDLQ